MTKVRGKRSLPAPLRIEIPSKPEKIAEVEAAVEQYLAPWVPSEDDRDSIAIALTEVLSNAIHHGNKLDPSKSVVVTVTVGASEVRVKVKDQGEGFDPSSLADPLAPENLLKASGRGIFILRALMDRVDFDFSHGGTLVTLEKKIGGKEA